MLVTNLPLHRHALESYWRQRLSATITLLLLHVHRDGP
jgi:succinate dehydrogenase hydrophobic anchor subunit